MITSCIRNPKSNSIIFLLCPTLQQMHKTIRHPTTTTTVMIMVVICVEHLSCGVEDGQ